MRAQKLALTAGRRALLWRMCWLGSALLPIVASLPASGASDLVFRGRVEAANITQHQFRLQDSHGKWRTLAEFRGRVVLMFFGYTQCPDVCPTELSRLARLMAALGTDAAKVQVLFVTLDPARDTAEVLQAYTGIFNPDFLGLRTDVAGTEAAARDFRVYFEKAPGRTPDSYTVDHSTFIYGFDTQGKLRVRLTPMMSGEDLLADVRALISAP